MSKKNKELENRVSELRFLCAMAFRLVADHHCSNPTHKNGSCKFCASGKGAVVFKRLHRIAYNLGEAE